MNKKLFLCSLLVLSGNSLLSASDQAKDQDAITDTIKKSLTYSELKENFKVRLSKKQSSLSYDEYNEFIEPYLQKAEKELYVIHYLMTSQERNEELVARYFDRLVFLCGADYINQLFPGKELWTRFYQSNCNMLKNVIVEFKNEPTFDTLEVENELEKTTQLFSEANKEFIGKYLKKQKKTE